MNRIVLECENIDRGKRVDIFLAENIDDMTRSAAAGLISGGMVLCDGRALKKSDRTEDGMTICVSIPDAKECQARPENIPVEIAYEDDALLVVNKPKGMVVHPAPGNPDGTLVNALLYHCQGSLSGINGVIRPGIVHRIDKDTSGLLIVAKNDEAHIGLSEQISRHSFVRRYETIISGAMREADGTIDLPIGRNPKDRKKMAVVRDGRPAVTHYQTLEVYAKGTEKYSRVRATLETGRTHQIRVHFSNCGHPVAGDAVYGRPEHDKKIFPALEGQCLHAGYIEFTHPSTGERLAFEAALPEYFVGALEILKKWE